MKQYPNTAPANSPSSTPPPPSCRARYLRREDAQPTPELAKAAVKRRAARVSRGARADEGLNQRTLALALSIDQSNFARTEIDGDAHALNVVHLVVGARSPLARPYVLRMFRWLTAEIDPSADVHGDNDGARLASVAAECGDVLRVFTAMMADGVRATDELELLEREAGELEAAAAEARRRFGAELQRRRER